jgi:hypothetical protein
MKIAILVALIMIITSGIAIAGNVYGTITEAGKGIGQGSKIEIACGADKYNTETDANGGFKVFVKDQGKCELKLTYQGQTPTFEINSFEGTVQYDLILEKKGTQYTLRRK